MFLVKDTLGGHKLVILEATTPREFIRTLGLYVTGLRHRRMQTPSRDLGEEDLILVGVTSM